MAQTTTQFEKQLDVIIRDLIAELRGLIGKPNRLGANERMQTINQILPDILKAIQESGYKSAYEAELKTISRDLQTYHKLSGVAFSLTATDKNTLTALRVVDLNKFNDLGSSAINNLYLQLKNLVISGASDKEYQAAIASVLDETLKGRAVTYANTARALYYQTGEDLIANEYRKAGEPVFWEYVGPEDNKNRDECVYALDKRFFTDAEREQFESEYGIRYNCRHTFMQVTEDIYNEGEKPLQDLTEKELLRREQVLELFTD